MADIELVIKIPEEEYKNAKLINWTNIRPEQVDDWDYVIANGTPLPKGHGRLIDADSIYQIVRPIEQSDAEWGMTAETAKRLMLDAFDKAPTIIEAGKAESEVKPDD